MAAGGALAISANAERIEAASGGPAGSISMLQSFLGMNGVPVLTGRGGGGGGGGGGVPMGVVDSISNFCRNSAIVSSGNVFDRVQMSNSFFIFS